MKKKADLYLENSVISMYYQENILPLMEITKEFWNIVLPKVNVFISDLVIIETRNIRNMELRERTISLVSNIPSLPITEDARALARTYLKYRCIAYCHIIIRRNGFSCHMEFTSSH